MKDKFDSFYDKLCDALTPTVVALTAVCVFFIVKLLAGTALVTAEVCVMCGSLALAYIMLTFWGVCTLIARHIDKKKEDHYAKINNG